MTRCPLFHERALFDRLFQVQHAARPLGGVRIVRHHHDRLLEFLVEPLQQRQHFAGRLGVEIAGRLVGQQQRRVGDDRAGDGDALFLPARQLARVVLLAVAEADDAERRHHVLAALLLRQAS